VVSVSGSRRGDAGSREPASAEALRDLDPWQDWLGEDDYRPLRLARCVAVLAGLSPSSP